jgi:hypothetical protein
MHHDWKMKTRTISLWISVQTTVSSHAEMFRFGVRTDWTSLCAYSLYRLMKALENFNLLEERTGDIVRLCNSFSRTISLQRIWKMCWETMLGGTW